MTRFRAHLLVFLTAALVLAVTSSLSTVHSQSANGKYDADGDGLIEVAYLEQLDAIRFDLDGDGRADDDSDIEAYASAFPTGATESVCNDNCDGYELARSLDFAAPGSYASGVVNEAWTTGEGWQPIQSGAAWIVAENPFAATFDGNGHTIGNLYIDRSADDAEDVVPIGLFGSTASDSVIRNVGLIDVHVAGLATVGGLVGGNLGEISDVHVTGRVVGAVYVGGLAGFTDYTSNITGSRFSGAVAGRETDGQAVGGLVGYQDGVIRGSHAVGSVSGNEYVGGLAGENRGYIIASDSSADVTGNLGVGGLAGVNRALISGSYATGDVGGDSGIGGLVGYNSGRISASYSTGAVTGDESVGGLSGMNHTYLADITASYATGQASGNENVGGLVGSNTDEAAISASYATGRVSGGDNLGGLIGFNDAHVAAAVWDTETSGVADGVGRGDAAGVIRQTTAELQTAAGYSGAYRDWELHLEESPYSNYVETHGPHDLWDFGRSSQYPALRAYLGFDGLTDWWDPGSQPRDARPPAPTPATGSAASPDPARYDRDGDGLIEVSNLEQLDAVRHDLDGDGVPEEGARDRYAAAYPLSAAEMVCEDNCKGYELTRSLDFASAESYASGAIKTDWTGGKGWAPMGDRDDYGGRFNAHFDGNGHAIANLHVNRTSSEEPTAVGLFGHTGYSAVIRGISIHDATITGLQNVGVLGGLNMGEISDAYVTGNVVASGRVVVYTPGEGHRFVGGYVGGLVGVNEGSIINSRADVGISCTDHSEYIGGLAGTNQGQIGDSHATGGVSCPDNGDALGGLIGSNWGAISNSYATGDISGDSRVAGLAGSQGPDGTILASYATGAVTGSRGVGGLAGGSSGVIRGSYASGEVTGGGNVGGLAGSNGGLIIASYATGSVSGREEVGGLVGSNNFGKIRATYAAGSVSGESNVGGLAGESHHSSIVASYAIGAVSSDADAGGLIGAESGTMRVSAGFWDTQTTGQETSAGGLGKTTSELQTPTGYTGMYGGWNADLDDADRDDELATGADDFWDFGTGGEYPALKFDFDGDGTATWQEFGNQERTAPPVAECSVDLVPAGGVVTGAWSSDCLSFNRPGSLARFYLLTLDANSEVFITLASDDVNTYLYVQQGAGTTGQSVRSQGAADRRSRIEDWFSAGTYTIEAATYEPGQNGAFTLTVDVPGLEGDCIETMTTPVVTGTWGANCASGRRTGSYARFYTFTITEGSEVIIDLESGEAGTYLYLLQGTGRAGEVLEDYGSGRGSAQLGHTLGAGTYTVEVTTYEAAQSGAFTLTINGLATPPPPPTPIPAPTPEPIPTATLPPAPTPTRVPLDTPVPAAPANTPTPTATPIAAQDPTPAPESGGGCGFSGGDVPPGAAAASTLLLSAPLVFIGILKSRARRPSALASWARASAD